jgi:hypothetical protein
MERCALLALGSRLVGAAGLEPAILGLGNPCVIQLRHAPGCPIIPSPPQRSVQYSRYMPPTLAERFWSKVDKDGPVVRPELGPCWIWKGATKSKPPHNYGRFRVKGKHVAAHRVAYALAHGVPLAEAVGCHKCDNPPCVNPDHLFAGSTADNVADMIDKDRQSHAGGPRRYVLDVEQILRDYPTV